MKVSEKCKEDLDNAKIKEFLRKVKDIAERMKKGEPEALYEMKPLLTYIEGMMDNWGKSLHDMTGRVKVDVLIMLFLTNKVLNDLWINFGWDTLGFPEDCASLVFKDINKNLGWLISMSFSKSKGEERVKYNRVSKVIYAYLSLLKESEKRIGKRITFPDTDS